MSWFLQLYYRKKLKLKNLSLNLVRVKLYCTYSLTKLHYFQFPCLVFFLRKASWQSCCKRAFFLTRRLSIACHWSAFILGVSVTKRFQCFFIFRWERIVRGCNKVFRTWRWCLRPRLQQVGGWFGFVFRSSKKKLEKKIEL